MLTLNLEVHYSKKEILEGYLNTINYGQGNFGIENASNYYFNKKKSNSNESIPKVANQLKGIPFPIYYYLKPALHLQTHYP